MSANLFLGVVGAILLAGCVQNGTNPVRQQPESTSRMSSTSRPRGLTQMAELRAGALLLVVEKPNLAAEAWFEERQSHGTVSFPSRQLLYASARNRTPL